MLFDDWDKDVDNHSTGSREGIESHARFRFSQDPTQDEVKDMEGLNEISRISKLEIHENPIFDVQKFTDYQPPLKAGNHPSSILYFASADNVAFIATDNSQIQRWNLDTDETVFIDIPKSGKASDQARKLFVDPSGHHLIISTTGRSNFYLHSSKNKLVLLPKPKSALIESVAWNFSEGSKESTGNILLGLGDGTILQTVLGENRQKYCSKVFELPFSAPCVGIETQMIRDSFGKSKWFVMAASPQIHYQFIGGPKLEQAFSHDEDNYHFRELPGELSYGELQFWRDHGSAKSCAHLTGAGVYSGTFDFHACEAGSSVVVGDKIISFSQFGRGHSSAPLSIATTEFHILLAYPDRLIGVNRLSNEIVFDRSFNFANYGQMIGFSKDESSDLLWLFSDRFIFEIAVIDERRDVWKIFLENNQFEEAFEYSSPEQKQIVLTAQANHLFNEEKYELSAHVFASSGCSFEEVALKFMNKGAVSSLKIFLLSKLQSYVEADLGEKVGKYLTQRTMISTWLVELFLDQINSMKGSDARKDEHQKIVEDFKQFLNDFKNHLHPKTVFQLMESHGLVEEMLYYSAIIGDWEKLLSHHVQNDNFKEALEVLDSLREISDRSEATQQFFYNFIPTLIQHEPKLTVDTLLKVRGLDPAKLLPALMRYRICQNHVSDNVNHAIRYLEYCIEVRGNSDPALHNYLVSLYATGSDEEKLVEFIKSQEFHECYDLKYALRLCHQEKKVRAGVLLYRAMGLFSDAVTLALSIPFEGFELAKSIAIQVPQSHPDNKKLWLLIGAHVVKNEKDVKKAMAILKECSTLHIEDILPLFPDDVQIGDFKDEISASLSSYTDRIEELKTEMNQYTNTADKIRRDIQKLRNRYGDIESGQVCDICEKPLLLAKFMLFPCTHAFHVECATESVEKHLQIHPDRLQYFENDFDLDIDLDLEQGFESIGFDNFTIAPQDASLKKERFRGLVDRSNAGELAKSECPLCGDVMIESVAIPFVDASREEEEILSWKI